MTTKTVADFVAANGITIKARRANANPNMESSTPMDHWSCAFTRLPKEGGKVRMTVRFSKGTGHNGAVPTVEEVLNCLSSDASGIENSGTFIDWCGEYGFDSDSRRSERIWKATKRQSELLKTFLGDDLYKTLLWGTEPL